MNYTEILSECGIETDSPQEVLKKLSSLEEFYDVSDVIEIYNYILLNIKKLEILYGTVKLVSLYKDPSTLPILLDILLKNTENNVTRLELIIIIP